MQILKLVLESLVLYQRLYRRWNKTKSSSYTKILSGRFILFPKRFHFLTVLVVNYFGVGLSR